MRIKRKLNVLILGEWDFAGCGYFLSQAINRHTDNTARAVRWHDSALEFPHDIKQPADETLRVLWKRADVVHVHDDYTMLPPDLPPRPVVVTYHGSLYRAEPGKYNKRDAALGWLPTAATLDLTILGPRWMPDTRPDMSEYVNRSPQFSIIHAPTNLRKKGTAKVLRTVPGVEFITGLSWVETLARKGRAWALLDQFTYGYGCNAIEAWLMGQAVISGATDRAILTLIEKQMGALPFAPATDVKSVAKMVALLRDEPEFYAKYVGRGREYVTRFHEESAVAQIALGYYHEAIERFYSRPSPVPATPPAASPVTPVTAEPIALRQSARAPKSRRRAKHTQAITKSVTLRYLGRNYGRERYTGTVTGRVYEFSATKPEREVDARDAPALLALKQPATWRGRGNRIGKRTPLFEVVR
jgi:hypothetical protein